MMTTTRPLPDTAALSAECTLAKRPGYQDLHGECRQTRDIPLPHATRVLLQRRCGCACHPWAGASS
ncbi:hypothetical protein [Streptomyces spinoverrucosus]|uniref:hypothetical protein n=1 Tax=Streptomyces spinoverrucosus TaxID=284043 RepID=UPI001E341052|nr:hypothetical protein [Streptomyces spinoverrucosus]